MYTAKSNSRYLTERQDANKFHNRPVCNLLKTYSIVKALFASFLLIEISPCVQED